MDRATWNEKVKKYTPPFGAFLQSWEWGVFQEALGRRIERIYEEREFGSTLALAVQVHLPLGQFYWYTPKGPIGNATTEKMTRILREKLEDGTFLRVEPAVPSRMQKVKDVQPSYTTILDLTKGEDEILASTKSKTRYNIRLAQRKGVVSRIVGPEYLPDFLRLMDQTTQRDRFTAHPSIYYEQLLKTLDKGEARASLAIAEFEGRVIAANILIDYQGTRTYLYGATSNLHRNVMAQYALHWFVIEDAIQKGMSQFDFFGIAPDGADKSHPWFGITRYKLGYGGKTVSMPGTFEIPMKYVMYSLYRTAKKLRH
ncbi:MAG: peptidoglycan bridge formation glycyltransferase FemA/FemB family protein [Patescibacteria group bacterium]|nr:peptidoglycan bridge formation glycyltransferase FemA/FemB family protein [Patescibacteria group bacterium]